MAEPAAGRARALLGPGRRAQPQHAVCRRDRPGRVRAAGPHPGALLPAAARASGQDPPARGEDPWAVVCGPGVGGLPRAALGPRRSPHGQVGDPPRPAGPAPCVLPGPPHPRLACAWLDGAATRRRTARLRRRPRAGTAGRGPPAWPQATLRRRVAARAAPVEQWPTQRQQQPKRRRTARAREAAQTAAAAHDRPAHGKDERGGTSAQPLAANVVPLERGGHARQVQDAIDAERRRRREQAVPVTPPPPPRLGETYRRSSLLILPPEERDAEDLPAEATSSASASEEDRWR